MEGLSGPLLGHNNPCETSVQVGNNVSKVVRGMVVTKGEADEFMVHTAISISNVKPADCQCFVSPLSLLDHRQEVQMTFSTAWDPVNKRLLDGCIHVSITDRELLPSHLRMKVYTLPSQEVKTMGLKLAGEDGSFMLITSHGVGLHPPSIVQGYVWLSNTGYTVSKGLL